MLHVRIDDVLGPLSTSSTLPAVDVGGGVTGYLSDRIGLMWDARYFRSVGEHEGLGGLFVIEQLSFWRASMAVVMRR
jgi:hypothetical protein